MNACRTLTVLLIGVLSIPASSPPALTSQSAHFLVDELDAQFVLPERRPNGTWPFLAVTATRTVNQQTQAVRLSAAAGIGSCKKEDEGFFCGAELAPYRVLEFESDSTTARVVLKRGKRLGRLKWTARTPYTLLPPISSHPNECGGSTTDITLLARNAITEGRILGHRVATKDERDPTAEHMIKLVRRKDCS